MSARLDPDILEKSFRGNASAPLDIRHLLIAPSGDDALEANGIYQVARALAEEQYAAGANARLVILRTSDTAVSPDAQYPPVEFVQVEGPKALGRTLALSHNALRVTTLGANGQTIFHIHTAREPILISLTRELCRRNMPYVVTVHGRYSHVFDDDGRLKHRLTALYVRTVERWALERARFVHAVTAAEHSIIRTLVPRANVIELPNAVFSSRKSGATDALQARRPSTEFPVFGFLGRYAINHKGLDLLLEGFAAYRRAGGKGRLELVGSGPERDTLLAHAAALCVRDSVTIGGPRYGPDKIRTIEGWDYFVSTSRFEGLPIAALEAAFLGVPLVVAPGTGLKERVVEWHAGIGIDRPEERAIAHAFREAEHIDPPEWQAMSKAVFALARSVGDWTAISRQMSDLYVRASASARSS
jgi:glycosyltransferase involved in cell wall biosynthesis